MQSSKALLFSDFSDVLTEHIFQSTPWSIFLSEKFKHLTLLKDLMFSFGTLHKKCLNTEFFLVCIFSYSVRIRENMDQKKTRYLDIFHTVKVHLGPYQTSMMEIFVKIINGCYLGASFPLRMLWRRDLIFFIGVVLSLEKLGQLSSN